MMPGMSGYEVCRQIRDNPATGILPVVMVTSLDPAQERIKGLEAGADDFLTKPVNQAELLARVRSLVRVKQLYDTVEHQAAQLAEWNRTLEARVGEQVAQLERLGRLKRFFSPQLAELIVAGDAEDPAQEPPPRGDGGLPRPARLHRVRGDGRARGGDGRPARVSRRDGPARRRPRGHARALHGRRHDGLLQRSRAGAEPRGAGGAHGLGHAGAPRRAAAPLAQARRAIWASASASPRAMPPSAPSASRAGSTTARSGPSRTWPRGSAEKPEPGQILVSQRLLATVEDLVTAEPIGDLALKGFARHVEAFNLLELRAR